MFYLSVGKNVVHQLAVTLEEMYNGSTRKLGLQKNVICEKCDGKHLKIYFNKIKITSTGVRRNELCVFNHRLRW